MVEVVRVLVASWLRQHRVDENLPPCIATKPAPFYCDPNSFNLPKRIKFRFRLYYSDFLLD